MTPKEDRGAKEPRSTPIKPNSGPTTTRRGKNKPYTVRYLTMEEVWARKMTRENSATEEQTTSEDTTSPTGQPEAKDLDAPQKGHRNSDGEVPEVPHQ